VIVEARSQSLRARARRLASAALVLGWLLGWATAALAVVDTGGYAGVTILPVDHSVVGGSVDWRTHGAVTPVKNEGACDASWAFGVTGLVEGFHFIQSGRLLSLSEQQLLDCDISSAGCLGGSPVSALQTLIAEGGAEKESNYPYTAARGTCRFNPTAIVARVPGAGRVPPGDEASLQAYVAKTGPVLALIDAGHASFDSYTGGIYYEPACTSTQPTRAVLIVGYGGVSGSEYWIVKTSLGTAFGMTGYILMSRNRGNNCGIASFALVVADDPIRTVAASAPVLTPPAMVVLLGLLGAVAGVGLRRRRRLLSASGPAT
jgi:Papain family cysteine protease